MLPFAIFPACYGSAAPDAGPVPCGPSVLVCEAVVPQCGCSSRRKCGLDASDALACLPDGDRQVAELCLSGDDDDCEAGSTCWSNARDRFCRQFCHSDLDCDGDGARCAIDLPAGADVPDTALCSVSCRPMDGGGCRPDQTCQVFVAEAGGSEFLTDCDTRVGDGVQGDPCDLDAGPFCVAGMSCIEGLCARWCDHPDDFDEACDIGTACVGFEPPAWIGEVEYGVCR
jgi:hypothetical protein